MELMKRKQNRLENYDYGEIGCYFVTLCTQNRKPLFRIENVGNDLCVVPCLQNQIIHNWIKETENKFSNIKFDKYVIMPDHLHFIVNITERHAGRSLHDVMRFFKTMTTNDYIKGVKKSGLQSFDKKLWQKSYYDHIIRNELDYNETWEYIENNPQKLGITPNGE
ncbi:MAG: transposase [Ruminococcaceae bacterium]|nr:transposase [Oscillospiraceae bacterium]